MRWRVVVVVLGLCALGAGGVSYVVPPVQVEDGIAFVEQGGVKASMLLDPANGARAETARRVSLRIVETAGVNPLNGLKPAGWLRRRPAGEPAPDAEACMDLIRRVASGGLSTRADIDLRQYYLYVLNSDRTITIINPHVSFSRTKLLGIVTLPAPAADWALDPGSRDLFVTLPSRGSVARIDTERRELETEVLVGGTPGRILIDPQTVWIGDQRSGEISFFSASGDPSPKRIDVGVGRVLLAAFRDESRIVAASEDRLSILDGRDRALLGTAPLAEPPTALAVSNLAGAAFLVSSSSGRVRIYDLQSAQVRNEVELGHGLSDVAITPDGRFALVANARSAVVEVLDTASGARTRTVDVEQAPDRITFSNAFAYVRSTSSANVTLIDWQVLDSPGSLAVVKIPIGRSAPQPAAEVSAASIDPAPGGGAVIAANRLDKTLYYYGEGMMAPMGSFTNYSREPLAVKIVDQSMQETAPGLYTADVEFPAGGVYDFPFVIESPRLAGCFEIVVEGPAQAKGSEPFVQAEMLAPVGRVELLTPTRFAFRLTSRKTGEPLSGLRDVRVLTFRPPGLAQQRVWAAEGEPGIYEARVSYPQAGEYFVLPACESCGLRFGDLPYVKIRVEEGQP